MTREELAEIGKRLYGAEWKHPLSRSLYIDYRTMRRWSSGQAPIPDDAARNARLLLEIKVSAERARNKTTAPNLTRDDPC